MLVFHTKDTSFFFRFLEAPTVCEDIGSICLTSNYKTYTL
nr:MAG TPA: hypothetical protein [Caudoviricetes sp.]